MPREICVKCGLVYLKNALTQWCIEQGCNHMDHTNYQKKLIELVDEHNRTKGNTDG